MGRLFSYIVKHDTGFAPNPFHGYCTLATCKPRIRKTAEIGDWIVGTGSKSRKSDGLLIYAMRVTDEMSFDEYWKDPRFRYKRPDKNGGKHRACGDNIYRWDSIDNRWCQAKDSFHCHDHMDRDAGTDRVLISDDYIYWGGSGPLLPEFSGVNPLCSTQGHKCKFPEMVVAEFVSWVRKLEDRGLCGDPTEWGVR